MKHGFIKLFMTNTNYYSFVSGIFAALAVNLYTTVFSTEEMMARSGIMLSSSALALLSSIYWMLFAWKLEPLQRIAIMQAPNEISPEDTLLTLLQGKKHILLTYFIVALILGIISLGILPLGYSPTHK